MKKKILATILAAMLALSFTACGSGGDSSVDTKKTDTAAKETPAETKTAEPVEESTYQSILDDYTQKIKDATPGLVDEYNSEAAGAAGDVNKLAEISNAKITKLAEISNEGISKMAELMLKNGDEQATYEEWAGKLTDVYMEYAQQITDAYMSSAQ
ncbi:MAG: hypothetical protein QM793_03430 [Muricomes sp.]